MDRAVDDFVWAREARGRAFCGCFFGLIGFDDAPTCGAAYEFSSTEVGCLKGIFDNGEEAEGSERFTSEPALECLTAAEEAYGGCLVGLACDDYKGLDGCIAEYNAALVECPRLSEEDTEDFDNCLLL